MKNPYGVEPTRYMKRQESNGAIKCDCKYGPLFGGDIWNIDLSIGDHCNEGNRCSIYNSGNGGYECHHEYKSSLFVKTAESNERNFFSVLDYEVYCIDYENKENINKLCKHPDIMMKYIETKDIPEESLQQVDDDAELLTDLDALCCVDNNIRLKISQYYLKNPSELLPNTSIVNQQYDGKLREWLGNNHKWKLLYRASEHNYTGESFHEYCDNKKPILVIIKSSGGWIFGGFTTKSWKVVHPNERGSIYFNMIY